MKVTAEMIEAALCVWDAVGEVEAPASWVPKALEAALSGVPEPGVGGARLTSIYLDEARLFAAEQRVAELESQLSARPEVTWPKGTVSIPALQVRVSELESAVQHADAVVETLSAERDDALNSLAVLRVALGAPDDSEEHGTRRSVGQLNRRVDQATSALTYVERLTAERDAALERAEKAEMRVRMLEVETAIWRSSGTTPGYVRPR